MEILKLKGVENANRRLFVLVVLCGLSNLKAVFRVNLNCSISKPVMVVEGAAVT